MSDLGQARGRIVIDTSDVRRAQAEVQQASRAMTSALNALGVGFSVQQFTRFVTEAEELATAYRRQSVAARELAGSQGQVNSLLAVYDRATGSIIGKAQSLSDVTRLLSVGFADSAKELDEFVRSVRGISLGTGRPQEFIVTNLQLELLNQTGYRLDQLGLGLGEVRKRAEELAAANSRLTQEQAYQQAVLQVANEKFGALTRSAEAQATEVEKLRKVWADFQLEMGQNNTSAVNTLAKTLNEQFQSVRKTIQGAIFDLQNLARLNAQTGNIGIGGIQDEPTFWTADPIGDFADRADRAFSDWLAHLTGQLTQSENALLTASARSEQQELLERRGISTNPAGGPPGFTVEQRQAIRETSDAMAEFEEEAGRARAEITRQYEEQRTQAIRQYELSIAREAEDFGRSRLRAEQDFNRSVERMQRDAGRRDQRAAEDLARSLVRANEDSAERIADLREDANQRLADLDKDFRKEQARRERDFKDDQLSAAGKLDAIALLELRKDRAKALQDAKEDHEEQVSDAKEQLDERIADEKEALEDRRQQALEAYNRQLEDAREADRQRLEDMQADFDLRRTREDEDRATRLGRMAEDHDLQLAEMERQHDLRIIQIAEQQARERAELEEQNNIALNEAKVFNDAWIAEDKRRTDAAVADYTRATQAAAANAAWLAQIAAGGGVTFPSLANPSLNLDRPIPAPAPIPAGQTTRISTSAINIHPGAIVIYGDGLNEQEVAEKVVETLEDMAGGGGRSGFR